MSKIVNLQSKSGKNLVKQLFKQKNVVLFAGSAISRWTPTSIPTGAALSAQIASVLAECFSHKRKQSAFNYLSSIPLEYLCERSPNYQKLFSIFPNLFYPRKENRVHKTIAKLVRSNSITDIITTNYDSCLEQAVGKGYLDTIVSYQDFKRQVTKNRVLFKIHGSAIPGREKTMVFRLTREGELPRWKVQLLLKTIQNKVLLLVGYSGADFEITPWLAKAKPKAVFWLTKSHPNRVSAFLTHNSRQVLDSSSGSFVKGDILDLFRCSIPKSIPTQVQNSPDLAMRIRQLFTPDEMLIWTCNVLVAPGYASYVEELSTKLQSSASAGKIKWAKATSMLAEGLFSAGKYKSVSALYVQVAEIFLKGRNMQDFFRARLKAIDSLRCYGDIAKAKMLLDQTKKALKGKRRNSLYLAKLELQYCLILREEYQRAKFLGPINSLMGKRSPAEIQNDFVKRARPISRVFAKRGEWHDHQQLSMWTARMDVDFKDVYSGSIPPPIDLVGWKRLGHKIQEMMATRDHLVRQKQTADISKVEINKLIDTADDMGCHPEVWKLTLTYAQTLNFWFLFRRNWIKAFFRCEYTPLMRFLKIAFVSYR